MERLGRAGRNWRRGYDEERKTAERCHDATLSEGEERAFRRSVAEVVRKNPKAKRIAVIPHPRFRKQPAGGGGTEPACPATIWNHKDLHKDALAVAVKFSLDTLRHKDDNGRWFVPMMTFHAIEIQKTILDTDEAMDGCAWRVEID